jgi:hypothetical protein
MPFVVWHQFAKGMSESRMNEKREDAMKEAQKAKELCDPGADVIIAMIRAN